MKIITTTELQKSIGQLAGYVTKSWVIVTKKGKPSAIMLPYFENNEEAVSEYLEDYEMNQNAEKLRAQLKASEESGLSDLVI